MIYMRGHRDNYDAWRDAGNAGWGFADVLPYFKRSEDNTRGASEYHGAGGPLHVSDIEVNPMSEMLVQAATGNTSIAWDPVAHSLTITLGAQASGGVSTNNANTRPVYTASGAITDPVGGTLTPPTFTVANGKQF